MISGMRLVAIRFDGLVSWRLRRFTAGDFSHHGTLSEVHVKLVEAHLR